MNKMIFAILTGAFLTSSFSQAAYLTCTMQKDVTVYYDLKTKVVYKKNGTQPIREIMSPQRHCMQNYSGPVTHDTQPMQDGEMTRYQTKWIDKDGYEWNGNGYFVFGRASKIATFECQGTYLLPIELRLTECVETDKME